METYPSGYISVNDDMFASTYGLKKETKDITVEMPIKKDDLPGGFLPDLKSTRRIRFRANRNVHWQLGGPLAS